MAPHNAISAIAIVLLGLLGQSAVACQLCSESEIHLRVPFMFPAIFLLGAWRIAYAFFQLKNTREVSGGLMFKAALRVGAVTLGFFTIFRAALLFYLVASFAKALELCIRNRRTYRSNRIGKYMIRLHAITLPALLAIVAWSYAERVGMDQLERSRKYTLSGTAAEREGANRIAENPSFDLERLRPLLEGRDSRDQDLAFQILLGRKKVIDLLYYKDCILEHSGLESALSEDWNGSNMYLRYWLHAIGIDQSLQTKEELQSKIEMLEQEPTSSTLSRSPAIGWDGGDDR